MNCFIFCLVTYRKLQLSGECVKLSHTVARHQHLFVKQPLYRDKRVCQVLSSGPLPPGRLAEGRADGSPPPWERTLHTGKRGKVQLLQRFLRRRGLLVVPCQPCAGAGVPLLGPPKGQGQGSFMLSSIIGSECLW